LQQYVIAAHKNQGWTDGLSDISETVMHIGHEGLRQRLGLSKRNLEALTRKA
jgi:hypothetical protein